MSVVVSRCREDNTALGHAPQTSTACPCHLQVSGHGNFGSIDDDPAAAMRYTECRLQALAADALLADLDADTVDFAPNFDASQVGAVVDTCVLSLAAAGLRIGQQQVCGPERAFAQPVRTRVS
jgi:hypothetical protein